MNESEMKFEIEVGTQMMIKPSSPTPHHKRCVKLSLKDQLAFSVPILLHVFYPPPATTINPDLLDQRAALRTSLSEILTHFYPYAGRIVDNYFIECTDQGVLYTEAQVNCCLSEVIAKHHHPGITLKHLLPKLDDWNEVSKTPLIIQSNFFKCGGFSLGVIGSHKIMDGLGLSTFIRSWALINVDQNNVDGHDVDFTVPSSLYPPSHLLTTMPPTLPRNVVLGTDTCVTKSFVFEGTSIAALKQKLGTTPQPTRVEAVSALIWKCAMKSSRSRSNKKFSSSIWKLAVNTRRRWEVPLPDNTPGNQSSSFLVKKVYGDGDKSTKIDDQELMCDLVYLFKDKLKEFCDNHMKKLQDNLTNRSSAILEYEKETKAPLEGDGIDVYVVTSWCGFKLYDADFGWGKPDWMGFGYFKAKNIIVLMDTKEGGGIEAWIFLEEQHMAAFEKDEDLLMFANHPTLFNP